MVANDVTLKNLLTVILSQYQNMFCKKDEGLDRTVREPQANT